MKDADIFSPTRVFGFVWFFSIGLADLKLSRLQSEWSGLSWIVLWLGVMSFFIGIFIAYVLTMASKEHSVREIRRKFRLAAIDENVLFWITTVFFCAYCFAFVIDTVAYGQLPFFSSHPDRARVEFGVFGIHLFISGGMPLVLILATEYFLLVKGHSSRKFILALEFLVTFVSHLFLLVRFTYMIFLLAGAGIAYYSSRLMKMRNVVLILSLIAVTFGFIVQVRETRYVQHYLYVISQMKYPESYAWITGPYMYISMNLENFARTVDRIDHYTYGYYTFDSVFALTGLKHWMGEYFGLTTHVYLTSGYNTFPFFFVFFQDFGPMGVAMFSMISGFTVGAVYHWMKSSASLLSIVLYGCCVYLMGISFFTNSASSLNFAFLFLNLAAVNALLQYRLKMGEVPP